MTHLYETKNGIRRQCLILFHQGIIPQAKTGKITLTIDALINAASKSPPTNELLTDDMFPAFVKANALSICFDEVFNETSMVADTLNRIAGKLASIAKVQLRTFSLLRMFFGVKP